MRNQEWDPTLAKLHPLDPAELVLRLLSLDTVDSEATLGVVDQAEVLAGLLDGDNIHETGGEGRVGADLAIDLDQALHDDRLRLTTVKGVLKTEIKNMYNQFQMFNFSVAVITVLDSYRLRMKTIRGRQSLSLWGPGDALGA